MSLEGSDSEKLVALGEKNYKAQAVWFLNAFWDSFGQEQAEKIWEYTHRFTGLDQQKKGEGNALDEFFTHHFLEQNKETLTVLQMREHLRSVGIDKVKLIPLIHFFIFRYKVDWHVLVNAPQGDPEEIARAQRLLEEVQAALAEAQQRADEAKAAEAEAVAREADAKRDEAEAKRTEAEAKRTEAAAIARETEAKAREADAKRTEADAKAREAEAQQRADELRAAKDELAAALAELQAQEQAYNNKTEDLKRKSEEGSVVQRNKAKNELAQHLSEDPLPLRRAKITQEAAVKKADRAAKVAEQAADEAAQARQVAEAAREEAEQARKQAESARRQAEAAREDAEEARRQAEAAREAAEEARREAERAREAAEEAVGEAERKVAEAEEFLEETKKNAGDGKGALWWIDRELHEAKAYMPTSKGGYKKPK